MLNVRIPEEEIELRPRLTVVGCGGAGCNAVNNMIRSDLQGVEFLACNSDAQSLKNSLAERKIQLGLNVTRGLGAGARPEVGRSSAEEALDEILGYLEGSNMVFITAGMGGGTGTGAAPVVARACREAGILTVGVVTKPFHFEGAHRMRLAEAGIEELQQYVDTLLIIPNQNLFRVANEKTTFADAFKMADDVLHAGVRGVTDLMVMPGLINLDFADIRSVMSEMGKAMMGTGQASGDRRAIEAAEAAINNPLLEDASMQGARGLLVNITGGMDMTLFEVDEAMNRIRDEVDPDANIIFGSTFNPELDGQIRVSVVATGIDAGMRQTQGTSGAGFRPTNIVGSVTDPLSLMQQAAQNKPSVITPNNFGRSGVTLRPGTTAAQAQQQAASNHPAPTRQHTGTTTASTQGAFYGRTATARRVEEAMQQPMTVGNLALDTAEDAFYAPEQAVVETAYEAPATPQPQPQMTRQTVQQRGEREGDNFIPPAPMVAETRPVSSTGAPLAAQSHVQQQQYQPVEAQAGQQHAKAYGQEEKKQQRPGLFDRLTGGSARQPSAPPAQPMQPTLTVDNSDRIPAGTTSFDDDLDIPAFLRRQAN